MEKLIHPGRLALMALITAALIVVSMVTLYKLQIVEGRAYALASQDNIVSELRIPAARGSIMDRYGRVLVENRICNNLLIDVDDLFGDYSEEAITKANATILTLATTITAFGDHYTDTLPITMEPPFEYTDMTELQRVTLAAWKKEKERMAGLVEDASAVEVMAFMRSRFQIDNSYTAEETRIIAGVRYEINARYIDDFHMSPYIFAQDVSMDLIVSLMENNVPGFTVETSFIRDYNTTYASQILGYSGMMSDDEVEKYTALGYAMDAQVGKDGVEFAFEEYLHGQDGAARVTRTASGVTVSTVELEPTLPGNNLYLTIDIGLQEAAENALSAYIAEENRTRQKTNDEIERYGRSESGDGYKQLITGGAAVAVMVETGEPLAIASWPSYAIATLMEDWNSVANGENAPMFNRALSAHYAPGSTFKPCVAIAALGTGKIDPGTTITCEGVYSHYGDIGFAPRCWIYDDVRKETHGPLVLADALTRSCNFYFYTLGEYLQIDNMARYAKAFGLGEHTGIELPEATGMMTSNENYRKKYDRDVYVGEVVTAAIGQAESEFTPLQLAEYCAALANGGTRYAASVVKTIYNYDFSDILYTREPEVLSTVEATPEDFAAVQLGMRGVVADINYGTAFPIFQTAAYTAAAKTGTAQTGEDRTNNAVFICYAPYEDPEIAVAVVVEKGSAGSAVATVARSILDYYFSFKDSTSSLERENTLLR